MRNTITIMLLTSLLLVFGVGSTFASWLIFSKPEFRGRIIDAETKEPIEGVVVVAMYRTYPIVSGPGGGSSSIIHVKEALTDKGGEFRIPAYTAVIQPNSYEDSMEFIIYKPGYVSYPHHLTKHKIFPLDYCSPEFLFSKEVGTEGQILRKSEVVSITYGVVELPKLKTKEERFEAAVPSFPIGSLDEENAPLLYKAMNEELKRFGSRPMGRVRE